jgi:uncharacterized membrane protein
MALWLGRGNRSRGAALVEERSALEASLRLLGSGGLIPGVAPAAVKGRMQFVDVARGVAMLLVLESHFGLMYFIPAGALRAQKVAAYIALPSAPIFVFLSGMVLGLLSRGKKFPGQRIRLVDRGLFLLLPAHFVIRFAHYWVDRGMGPGARWVFMTDAIGVCLLIVPWIVTRVDGWGRVLLGLLLFAISWCVYLAWWPKGPEGDLIKAILVGDVRQKGAVFALLPWLAAYVIATVVGQRVDRWRHSGDAVAARLLALGCGCAVPSVIGHLLSRGHGPTALLVLSAGQKYPPSAPYLLGSAALGCAILAAAAWIEDRGLFPRVFAVLALVGRNSLVVFVLQYFVYYVGFFLLRLPMSPLWPLYFGISILINVGCAWVWEAYFGNQYLTVGFSRLVDASRTQTRTRPA